MVTPGSGNDVRHQDGSSGLLGNVPVNGLDEWDINKLGWFKFRPNRNGEEDPGDHMDTGHQVSISTKADVLSKKLDSLEIEYYIFVK